MRRETLKTLAVLALVWALLTSMGAACAQGVDYDAFGDVLTISCDRCVPGGEYALLLLRKGASYGSLEAGDVYFIDQITAGEDGRIEAAFVSPGFDECNIVLGGEFADGSASPVKLGTFKAIERRVLDAPDMLVSVEDEAFEGSAFTHVYLGENVTDIGSRAFADCDGLVYVYIPQSTTSIAGDAFSGSDGVVIGCHENSDAQQYAVSKGIPYRLVE